MKINAAIILIVQGMANVNDAQIILSLLSSVSIIWPAMVPARSYRISRPRIFPLKASCIKYLSAMSLMMI